MQLKAKCKLKSVMLVGWLVKVVVEGGCVMHAFILLLFSYFFLLLLFSTNVMTGWREAKPRMAVSLTGYFKPSYVFS